jgi:uncharacterized membrane protein
MSYILKQPIAIAMRYQAPTYNLFLLLEPIFSLYFFLHNVYFLKDGKVTYKLC